MDINDFQNAIIVADRDYFNLLLQKKKAFQGLSFKLMDKEEVIDKLSFSYGEDPLPYLVYEKKMDYSTAKKYMRILRVADREKNEKLTSLYNELKERFLEEDDLAEIEFNGKKIYLLEMNEDREIHGLFERKHLSVTDISLKDMNILPLRDENALKEEVPLYYFPNRFQQYFYAFSRIRKEVLEHEEKKEKIEILVKDDSEEFYIRTMSEIFSLPVIYNRDISYISIPSVKDKISDIFKTKSFEFTEEEKKNPDLSSLIEVIDEYHLASLDFDFAYSNLLEIVSSLKTKGAEENTGVFVSSRFDFDPRRLVYVMDFTYDTFYKEYQNKSVFTDEELKELSVNTSYEQTLLDQRKKRNYLFYQNIVLLSRVLMHLNDHIFDSQFIAELNLSDAIKKVDMTKKEFFDGSFTDKARELYISNQIDKQFITDRIDEFNSYDNSYTPIQEEAIKHKEYSISKIEQYVNCPFKYLMQNIIPLLDEDKSRMHVGTFLHTLMEKIYHKGFSANNVLFDAKDIYIDILNNDGVEFDEKEEVRYSMIAYWMHIILSALENENEEMNHYDMGKDYEIEVNFSLQDKEGNSYPFKGRIDKILTTSTADTVYYTIIDYKSGKERFDDRLCFLGKAIQLPLYSYALMNDPSVLPEGAKFMGFGIQHIYPSSIKSSFAKDGVLSYSYLVKYLMTEGALVSTDADYKRSLNTEYTVKKSGKKETELNKPSFFSLKMEKKKEGGYDLIGGRGKSKYCHPLDDIIQESIDISLNVINKIKANLYPIAPLQKDLKQDESDDLSCSYCKYQDICYHRKKDAVHTGKAVKAHMKQYMKGGN